MNALILARLKVWCYAQYGSGIFGILKMKVALLGVVFHSYIKSGYLRVEIRNVKNEMCSIKIHVVFIRWIASYNELYILLTFETTDELL